jgi:cation transport ATPase
MGERKPEELPMRVLHDFLFELDAEWGRFRMGSLLSIVTTILLFVLFIPRYFLITIRKPGIVDTLTAMGIITALVYSVYLSYRQHKFYRRWEKRMGLLLHFEEELLGA